MNGKVIRRGIRRWSELKEADSPVQDTMPQFVITGEKNLMISGGASAEDQGDDPGSPEEE